MDKIILLCLMFGSLTIFAQQTETEKILNEGKLLYRLEKASWYGTDDMLERFDSKKDSIGGYLSYETNDKKIYTIFFSKNNPNTILIRYQFDSLPKKEFIQIDTINQLASKIEQSLIVIRQDTRNRVSQNLDDFFNFYDNTSLNYIPIITKNKRQVFVLTATSISEIVLLGNDYITKYDDKNNFKSKEKIHNSILSFPYQPEDENTSIISTHHSHIVTPYISSTDICTLLLHKDYIEWEQHYVISEKWVSIFDLKKISLFAMKRKAWEKIYSREKNKK